MEQAKGLLAHPMIDSESSSRVELKLLKFFASEMITDNYQSVIVNIVVDFEIV